MEMANGSLKQDEVNRLVDEMFIKSGLQASNSLKFKDFTLILNNQMDLVWNVCIDWKGFRRICFYLIFYYDDLTAETI